MSIERPYLNLSDQFLIDGDTSDTRSPFKRPSVIFPSVENKPTIVNSSFTYDAGKNLNGVTVDKDERVHLKSASTAALQNKFLKMTIVLSHLPPDVAGLLVRRPLRQGTEGERYILPSN